MLAALHRRHDRDLVVRLENVIAPDEFHPGADEKRAIPFFERGMSEVELREQIGHARSDRQIEREFVRSDDFLELGKELHTELHRWLILLRSREAAEFCLSAARRCRANCDSVPDN